MSKDDHARSLRFEFRSDNEFRGLYVDVFCYKYHVWMAKVGSRQLIQPVKRDIQIIYIL